MQKAKRAIICARVLTKKQENWWRS